MLINKRRLKLRMRKFYDLSNANITKVRNDKIRFSKLTAVGIHGVK